MKRTALIAGVSVFAVACAVPTAAFAAWNSDTLWRTAPAVSNDEAPVPKPVRARPRPAEKVESKALDKTPVPTGVLHIIVSIDKQRATLFADGQPVASTAISSGTPGHPTPTGLFTIIQKSRHHVSNLYNASMPYMQRITWSGSALHQGPLPGYPASHGCIRLTETFANLLWKTTKMGARVVITRPDVAPQAIDHPRLFVPKPRMVETPPIPVASPLRAAELQLRAAATVAVAPPLIAVQPAAPQSSPPQFMASEPATTSGLVKTADVANAVAIMSAVGDDAKAVATSVETEPAANTDAGEQATKLSATDGTGGTPAPQTAASAEPAEPAEATEVKSAEAQPAESQPAIEAQPIVAEQVATTAEVKPAAAVAAEPKPAEVPLNVATSIVTVPAIPPIIVDERPATMPATAAIEADGRPISVFASLKEGKLYVRKGWKPLFDAPITFERPEQPVGTHVYTAMSHKVDGSGLRWSVVSIPSSTRRVAELKASQGQKRHREPVKTVEVDAPMPPASTALDRIVMPPELMARISELITPGSSLIVSDNKLSDETGEYTDFIVTTR